jgi:DNA repair protein RAD5
MGKTIMLSALIQTNRNPGARDSPDVEESDGPGRQQLSLDSTFRPVETSKGRKADPTATLIVAPTSLLMQWSEELERSSTPGTMKIIVWHGTNRLDLGRLQSRDDKLSIIITSYGTLASEHAKVAKSNSAIFDSRSSQHVCRPV